MSLDENKAVYRRFIQRIFNEGRIEELDDLVTWDYAIRDAPMGTPAGPEAVREVVTMFRHGFPDLEILIEDQIAEGDKVASRTIMRGTHFGEIFGIAPTGRKVSVPGLTMVRIADGKVAESWVKNDTMALMGQLGGQG